MALPDKFDDNLNTVAQNNAEEDYEIIAEKEVKDLRDELKKAKEFEIAPSKRMHVSINELNNKLDKLINIFDETSRNLKTEEGGLSFQEKMRPLAEKMNKILEQNSEIAEGIVALADLVKDFRDDLENKGITISEKKEQAFAQPLFSAPQLMQAAQQTSPFPPRLPSRQMAEMQRIAPPPFESPRPPQSPPPFAPPKKRLFGI